jgi:hypothetical protein
VIVVTLVILGAPVFAASGGEPTTPMPHPQREDLVGTWRLLSIDILAAGQSRSDPFYGANCAGLLIYDASGAMSVQIVGHPRVSMPTPSVRGPIGAGDERRSADAQRARAVLATYYAYFGTWEYDAPTGVVTHHVTGSLYPDETGVSYDQQVTLTGDRMTFTVRGADESWHRKVWQRVRGARDVRGDPQ